jgi:small subunit ribosomal protein S6
MPLYEHVFLTRQDASNAQVDALTDQFKGVIAGLGGKVTKNEYWGVKSLSFRIRKNRKAHFSFFNVDAPPAAIAEMERQMSINEDVIRFMTIRVEKLEDGPSVMMKPSRRDDRDEFGMGGGFEGGRGGGGGGRGRRDSEAVQVEAE